MSIPTERFTVQSQGAGYELADYLNDIAAVVDCTNSRPVLCGYSHTAFFTVHYALNHPERLSALILVEPALFNERAELLSRAHKALAGDEHGSITELLKNVQPDLANDETLAKAYTRFVVKSTENSSTMGMELLARANNPISRERLSTLKMPVLLIGGTKSHAKYTVHRSAEALPNAFVWWVEGATHMDIMGPTYSNKIEQAVNAFHAAMGLDRPAPSVN